MKFPARNLAILLIPACLAACSLVPDMHKPDMPQPESFKEAHGNWLKVDAAHPGLQAGWWKTFSDDALDTLEQQAAQNNEDLKQAFARLNEARAQVGVDAADFYPKVTFNAAPGHLGNSATVKTPRARDYNDFLVQGAATYEVDLWGRVRAQVSADKGLADASADDLAVARLTVQAELARDYFTLRGYDELGRLLDQTVASYQKAYDLTQHRHKGGIATESDVTQAQTQLYNAKTRAADNQIHRAQAEHALAVLTGQSPAGFDLPAKRLVATIPTPPDPGLPSALLLRRPDIASAARQMEAANAEIGVARAAYFPDLSLGAAAGFESKALSSLFEAPSLLWSLGAAALTPVFEGGKLKSLTRAARARYDESAARYRGTVLAGIQGVEDALVANHQLEIESRTQTVATNAAEKTLSQIRDRYAGGVTNFLDVVVAQNAALQAETDSINIHTERLLADIDLIRTLGGGWTGDNEPVPVPAAPRKQPSPFWRRFFER